MKAEMDCTPQVNKVNWSHLSDVKCDKIYITFSKPCRLHLHRFDQAGTWAAFMQRNHQVDSVTGSRESREGASCIWLLFRSLHHDIPRHEGMEWAWNESLWQQLSARNSGNNCSNVPDAVHLHVHLRVRYGKSAGRFGVEAFHWIL